MPDKETWRRHCGIGQSRRTPGIRLSMTYAVGLAFLVGFVTWGATTTPGRPFSWAMYAGSSKGFLWIEDQGEHRWASLEDIRLAPDAYFLRSADLKRLLHDCRLPSLQGVLIGYHGTWKVHYEATKRRLSLEAVGPTEDLRALAGGLRRV